MLSTDNSRDWYSGYADVLRCLVPEASVDSRSELIQNPLRNVQPIANQHAVAEKVID